MLRQTPGHIDSRLYREVSAPCSYVIISEWKDAETFAAFIKSDAFRNTTSWGLSEILMGRPRHKVYQS